eukprot:NODE_775_length_1203_cov_62.244424_g735_i0.p1 GENE.NODE_775_length_1203_cov_62.244424_g735_i0~~NODE_775_length_1203_cov_62.244424_g735_i0.p1  ORF type:complete len:341 (+),score=86.93 NODE_775_length_1203_cov_62.244424_g735_i0:61-1083(+)
MLKLLVTLLAVLAVAFGAQEKDQTLVQLVESGNDQTANGEHFVVNVVHVQNNFGPNGTPGERDVALSLQFDVSEDRQILCNQRPVELGLTSLTFQAVVIENGVQTDERVNVDVRVFINVETNAEEQLSHRFTIHESVVGVEGSSTWTAEIFEQVIDVHHDGQVEKHGFGVVELHEAPEQLFEGVPEHHHSHNHNSNHQSNKPHHNHGHGHGQAGPANIVEPAVEPVEPETPIDYINEQWDEFTHSSFWASVMKFKRDVLVWYSGLPFVFKVLVSTAFFLVSFTFSFAVFYIFFSIICCVPCRSKKTKATTYESNLRIYATEYTAIPQDEKSEKKQAEQLA